MTADVKILVVDDDRYLLDLLIETLKTIGYDATGVTSAEEALQHLESASVQLVITDIRMPGMDGVEFARRVKSSRPELPVIFITGVFNSSVLRKVEAEGFLAKPFRINQVEELIEEVMANAQIADNQGGSDRILVVDDDEAFRQMLMESLKLSGYQPVGASNSQDALSIMEKKPVNAVITDVRMPGMDGITLAGYIKERWPGTPVIMITGYIPAEHEAPLDAEIADGFLMKPFKIDSITELLESLRPPRTPPTE